MNLIGNNVKTLSLDSNAFPTLQHLHIDPTTLDETSKAIIKKFEENGCVIYGSTLKSNLWRQ